MTLYLDDLVLLDNDPEATRDGSLLGCACEAGGAFVGWVSLGWSSAQPEELELGYRMRRQAWGHGLATARPMAPSASKTLTFVQIFDGECAVVSALGENRHLGHRVETRLA
jgi:hypothetical protein